MQRIAFLQRLAAAAIFVIVAIVLYLVFGYKPFR